jgi:hypothetical protein
MTTPPVPPIDHRCRLEGPDTAKEAARRGAKAAVEVMNAVESVMRDGVPRTDHEICAETRKVFMASNGAIRVARNAWRNAGRIVRAGKKRTAPEDKAGALSLCIAWQWVTTPAVATQRVAKPHRKDLASAGKELVALVNYLTPYGFVPSDNLREVINWMVAQ